MDGYGLHLGEWVNEEQFHPRHNIAPRSQAPVIRGRRDVPGGSQPSSSSNHSNFHPSSDHANSSDAQDSQAKDLESGEELVLHTMKWGLVPHWSKHEDLNMNTINARSEALLEGTGMWRSLRGWKRCVVPCEG